MKLLHGLVGAVLAFGLPIGFTAAQSVGGRYAHEAEFLPADLAFRTSMMTARNGDILLRWDMPPGYYLYRDKLRIEALDGMTFRKVKIPAGFTKNDPFLGQVEIYRNSLTVVVDRASNVGGSIKVVYQGCAEDKICYPPMSRTFQVPGGQCRKGTPGAQALC